MGHCLGIHRRIENVSERQPLLQQESRFLPRETTVNQLRGEGSLESPVTSREWVIDRRDIQITNHELGRGAWGVVYRGRFRDNDVAVKEMHHAITGQSRCVFEREVNMASKCRHRCLLSFIGATADERPPLLVTELLDCTLRKKLFPSHLELPLPVDSEPVISLDVADALNYLHEKKPEPILHNDVSSSNVLLWRSDGEWRAKLSDYGSVNFVRQSNINCAGAPVYCAPEFMRKEDRISCKADVYSYGVLLCEMSIRQEPNRKQLEMQIDMIEKNDQCSLKRRIVRSCVHEDPANRPSMDEVIEELMNCHRRTKNEGSASSRLVQINARKYFANPAGEEHNRYYHLPSSGNRVSVEEKTPKASDSRHVGALRQRFKSIPGRVSRRSQGPYATVLESEIQAKMTSYDVTKGLLPQDNRGKVSERPENISQRGPQRKGGEAVLSFGEKNIGTVQTVLPTKFRVQSGIANVQSSQNGRSMDGRSGLQSFPESRINNSSSNRHDSILGSCSSTLYSRCSVKRCDANDNRSVGSRRMPAPTVQGKMTSYSVKKRLLRQDNQGKVSESLENISQQGSQGKGKEAVSSVGEKNIGSVRIRKFRVQSGSTNAQSSQNGRSMDGRSGLQSFPESRINNSSSNRHYSILGSYSYTKFRDTA